MGLTLRVACVGEIQFAEVLCDAVVVSPTVGGERKCAFGIAGRGADAIRVACCSHKKQFRERGQTQATSGGSRRRQQKRGQGTDSKGPITACRREA